MTLFEPRSANTPSVSERIFSVSQITGVVKSALQMDPALQSAWVEGEVSGFTRATSGHLYFTIKDDKAALSCVMWRYRASSLPVLPKNGEAVIVHGAISVYEPRGTYQLIVDSVQSAGVGRLHLEFEALKRRLHEEGLFDEARKRPLPVMPRRIGVVTSAQAAALRDILKTLRGRFPLVDVLLAPSLVQGNDAPAQIVAALERLNRWSVEVEPVDVIIVARGGGSIEDLWAFNDERVARAIVASAVPVISGVGHETDFTIADFVADKRAATPTAAAAAAVPDGPELSRSVRAARDRLAQLAAQAISGKRDNLATQQRVLGRVSPAHTLEDYRQRVDDLARSAERSWGQALRLLHERLSGLSGRLQSVNPNEVLARGYSIVRHKASDSLITMVADVVAGDPIIVQVSDGQFEAEVR